MITQIMLAMALGGAPQLTSDMSLTKATLMLELIASKGESAYICPLVPHPSQCLDDCEEGDEARGIDDRVYQSPTGNVIYIYYQVCYRPDGSVYYPYCDFCIQIIEDAFVPDDLFFFLPLFPSTPLEAVCGVEPEVACQGKCPSTAEIHSYRVEHGTTPQGQSVESIFVLCEIDGTVWVEHCLTCVSPPTDDNPNGDTMRWRQRRPMQQFRIRQPSPPKD